jgi:hypothetical protein
MPNSDIVGHFYWEIFSDYIFVELSLLLDLLERHEYYESHYSVNLS